MKRALFITFIFLSFVGCSSKRDNHLSAYKPSIEVTDYSFKTETSYLRKSMFYEEKNDYKNALKYTLMALKIQEKQKEAVPITYQRISKFYDRLGNSSQAKIYALKAVVSKKRQTPEEKLFYERVESNSNLKNEVKYQIREIDKNSNNSQKKAKEYLALAQKFQKLNSYKKALAYALKALEYEKSTPRNQKKPNFLRFIYLVIHNQYFELDQYSKAQEYMFKVLNLIEDKNSSRYASVCNRISDIYETMGEYKKALKYGFQALKIQKKSPKQHIKLFKTHLNLSVLFQNLGDLEKAKQFATLAIEDGKKIKDWHLKPRKLANGYNTLSLIYYDMGELKEAKAYTFKALKIREGLTNNRSYLSESYNSLGNIFISLGDYQEAKEYFLKSLNLEDSLSGKATNYMALSLLEQSLNHLDEAKDYALKGLEIDKKISKRNHISLASDYGNLARLYVRLKDFSLAKKYIQHSISIYNHIDTKHPYLILAYSNLAYIATQLNDDNAKDYAQKAINIAKKQKLLNEKDLASSYRVLSLSYQKRDNFSEAYLYAKKAFLIFNINKNKNFRILDSLQKFKYLQMEKNSISNLLRSGFLYKNRSKEEVFNYWLNYKRTLFDIENRLKSIYQTTYNSTVKLKIDKLYQARREMAQLYQISSRDSKKQKNRIKNRISLLEEYLGSIVFDNRDKISYQDISNYLKQYQLYIDFARIEENYYLFTIDKSEKTTLHKLDAKAIDTVIKSIQTENQNIIDGKTFANIKKAKEQYGKLYNLIFSQIDIKNKKSLIISPDGLLSLIPFEAFYDKKEKKYLIEKVKINYIPSGKELVNLYKKSEVSNNGVVVFANPDFGVNSLKEIDKFRRGIVEALYEQAKGQNSINQLFKPLNGTEKEALAIKKLYPNSQIYRDKEASETNFFRISQPKILHLSTHGFFLKDEKVINPMLKSGIALSGANYAIKNRNGEGIVTALEISGLNLKGTELVVLSACETGVGEVEEAEGVAGINKAFMKAGAKYIVMSLWSVSDNATAILMKNFYGNIKNNRSYGTALRDSKIEMIKNGKAHPYYWSGFVGSGIDN